ncbi:MAG: efflux RND transporter periplasmic adaptor subunit [Gammaproteobacteria bacterium]|nr:efflux RND transporter periplasmic adaptor subunit [Gammaproteobacteria bacterium]
MKQPVLNFLAGAAALVLPLAVLAHGGEDHDLTEPAAGGGLKPRVELHSEALEVLGVLVRPDELRLYVDEFASNAPVEKAGIEAEIGGALRQAEALAPGEYRVKLPALKAPGKHPLVLTVTTASGLELLDGSLVLPAPEAEEAEHEHAAGLPRLAWVGLAALLALVLGLAFRRWRGATALGLALTLGLFLGGAPRPGLAHGGEEHAEETAKASAELVEGQPKRLADGTVYLPKPTQHLLGLRTEVVRLGPVRQGLNLNGRIIADANAGGLVAAPQAGRVRPGPAGFPVLGAKVAAGQVLAYLEPALSAPERAALAGELAQAQAELAQAQARVARQAQLTASIAAKDRAAAKGEAAALQQRVAALKAALIEAEPVRAPVAGVVASRAVLAGQVVAAGETLFSLHDPARHWVEALAYEPALAARIQSAELVLKDRRLPLKLLGAGRELRDQALPVQFSVEAPAAELAVDQPVRVQVSLDGERQALSLPEAAVVRGGDGLPVVFVHQSAERFEPHRVEVEPVAGGRLAVRRGLHEGDRVVSEGASLLVQVR